MTKCIAGWAENGKFGMLQSFHNTQYIPFWEYKDSLLPSSETPFWAQGSAASIKKCGLPLALVSRVHV